MLYNDALIPMVGANKHPGAMARPAFEVLPEIRELIEPLFARVHSTGEATWSEDLANPQILRAWGKGPDVVGQQLAVALPHLRDQHFIGYLDDVYRTGVAYEGRSHLVRLPTGPNGELQDAYFNFVYAPLRDAAGAIEGTLISAFDVTDQVRARSESEHARGRAEAAEAAQRAVREFQERFVAVLGHDLRNPLGAIAMATGLLKQRTTQAGDSATARVVDRIASSSTRMSRMVEQILDLSRTRVGGGLEVKPAPMDLGAMLATVIEELRTAYPSRTIELRCPSLHGSWDRDRLEQVFSNLIGNAIHHGDANTPITIAAHEAGDLIRVDVHNAGPPIPEPVRATLFDPFRRGERDSRSSATAGLGLGLYISRELASAHGGDITVRSNAAEGTTFSVTLPHTALNLAGDQP